MNKTAFRSWAGLVSAVFSLLLLAARPALADVPSIVNFQGTLTSSGTPVNASVSMTFRLYDVASGGTALWTETQTVAVNGGIYNVRLGSVSALNLTFDLPYFLGVSVGADAEMTPRQPLTSVPYAMRAGCNPGDIVNCSTHAGCTPGTRECNPSGLGWGSCIGEQAPNCGANCANLQTDVNNCGTCGHVCSFPNAGAVCAAGTCAIASCNTGFVNCPIIGCKDVASDPTSCGGCGTICAAGASCVSGNCVCPVAQVNCGGALGCVDLTNNPNSCGTCGHACVAGAACASGNCVCPVGQVACPAGCKDLTSDPNSCGTCGHACNAGQACVNGNCV